MKITIYRDSTLLIPKDIIDEKLLDKYYTVANPKYLTAKRFMKRVDPNIPQKILFYQIIDIEGSAFIELPRYAEIDSVIKSRYADSYEIIDMVKVNSYNTDPTVKFTLRDYQKEYVDKHSLCKKSNGVISANCGHGKCHGFDTPIRMHDTSVKMVQEIKVGDLLLGDDGTPRKVLSLAQGREMMYRINQVKGMSYVVNESHILSLKIHKKSYSKDSKGDTVRKSWFDVQDIPLTDILSKPNIKSYLNSNKGYKAPLMKFSEKPITIDPYFLGLWLGDGNSHDISITNGERSIINQVKNFAKNNSCNIRVVEGNNCKTMFLSGNLALLKAFRDYGFLDKKNLRKFIPNEYLTNSVDVRRKLLAGILDTDGSLADNGYDIIQKSKEFAYDIRTLCKSLGLCCEVTAKVCTATNGKLGNSDTYYRSNIHGEGLELLPMKLSRKKAESRKQIKNALHTGISIEKLDVDNYYGFTLDGNQRYCLEDFTVTHNTLIAIYLITQIKKRAIVFVPTNFLRDQWYEWFESVTENLSILSFDDKHNAKEMNFYDVTIITLEMYNARVNKMDSNIFDIAIFDEAHRLGATSYVDITNQLTAKYRFALSATFRRSDGMDSILHKAFGEQYIMPNQFPLPRTVFMDMSQLTNPVTGYYNTEKDKDKGYIHETVKNFPKIEICGDYLLINNPDDIMEVMYSCGKQKEKSIWQKIYTKTEKSVSDPNYPAIDSIITAIPILRKTIIRLIDKCLRNGRKPLVISKRVDLLKFLYYHYNDMVTCQIVLGKANGNFDGTKINPENQILFGISQLASEGLDADFLDTLILCNPSSDIEQAYGRIRRLKEGKKYPTVIQFKGLHAAHDKISNPYSKVFKSNSLKPEIAYGIREIDLT